MKYLFLFIGFQETFFILVLALLLFGPKKIPELARVLGEGIRQLRNASDQIKQEIWEAGEKIDQIKEESTKEINNQINSIKEPIESSKREIENSKNSIKRE